MYEVMNLLNKLYRIDPNNNYQRLAIIFQTKLNYNLHTALFL